MVLSNETIADIKSTTLARLAATFLYTAFGTGTANPSATDTALGAEVVRNINTSSSSTTSVLTVSAFLSSIQGNGSTISEQGSFDASTSGNLKNRTLLSVPIAKTSDKEVWIDNNVTVAVTQG